MSLRTRLRGLRPRPPRAARLRGLLAGRTVVITGASRGIGAECARRFARAGAHVVLLARTATDLETVAAGIRARGGRADVVPVDLRDTDAAETAARSILAAHGTPVAVISNAGHSITRTLEEYADRAHDVARLTAVNHVGPVALLRVLIPAMRAAGGGRVVSVSSVSAVVPAAGWSMYGASKAATDAWCLAVAQEVGPEVGVAVVRLPLVATAMSAGTYPGAAAMRPVDAAALIARALFGRRRVHGPWWLPLAGALLAVFPRALDPVVRGIRRGSAARESVPPSPVPQGSVPRGTVPSSTVPR